MADVKILKRHVTAAMKKRVAGIQRFTCAGNVSGYKCPLNGLPFDESGYDIDHIKPLSEGGTNETSNLQALCLMCHRVKSNRAASGNVKPAAVKKEAVKKVKAPKVEEPKKSYSCLINFEEKEFSDIDQMMKFVDQHRVDKNLGYTDLTDWQYRVRIPVEGKIVIQKEFFPSFSDPAIRLKYKLGIWR